MKLPSRSPPEVQGRRRLRTAAALLARAAGNKIVKCSPRSLTPTTTIASIQARRIGLEVYINNARIIADDKGLPDKT